ncbi:DUF2933 domain-containing protein [Domibacillus robiginosus]|uniref:DUF2933 domain-containing protein n=1 Tax=Domibacillus robiginosus TaxID=1071054 RepID=UPI00067DDABB|nr:DUF2933 domain-containing protein [Domibacillus robiginosus]
MAWIQIVALLLCPLMMLFCMKGMFRGHKHSHSDQQQPSATELQELKLLVDNLTEKNRLLTEEVQFIKEEKRINNEQKSLEA